MRRRNFDADERMINISYWIIFVLIVISFLAVIGGCGWAMWIITKMVTA
jgi:hypothetical protein